MGAGVEELLEPTLDIADVIVGRRARLVPVRIEADVLVADLEADVIRRVRIRLDSQQFPELRFGLSTLTSNEKAPK